MNTLDSNRLDALKRLSHFFDGNKDLQERLNGLAGPVSKFSSLHKELLSLASKTDAYLIAKLQDKKRLLYTSVLQKSWVLLQSLKTLVLPKGQEQDWYYLNYTESAFMKRRESEVIYFTTYLVQQLNGRQAELKQLALPDSVDELEQELSELSRFSAELRDLRSSKTGTSRLLKEKLSLVEKHVRTEIDPILYAYRFSNEELYRLYKEARKVKRTKYLAKALFSSLVSPNSTQTVAAISYQPNSWLLITNKAKNPVSLHLSMIKDIALGEGVMVPPNSTVYRQLKHLHPDSSARFVVVKNNERREGAELEIWLGG